MSFICFALRFECGISIFRSSMMAVFLFAFSLKLHCFRFVPDCSLKLIFLMIRLSESFVRCFSDAVVLSPWMFR